MADSIGYVTNNVKGLSNSQNKRLNIFKHLKSMIKNRGFIFLQETHSCEKSVKDFKEDFGKDDDLIFCHGASNARGVAIGICGKLDYAIKKQINDNQGRYLILNLTLGAREYVLVNFYNENIEKDQLKLLQDVDNQLSTLSISLETTIAFAGDFNFYFDMGLEATGGNPTTKTQSIAKFINIKEKYDLCDIWRVRNPNAKKYTFRQRHHTGYLQRRLDYIFVSNHMQPNVNKTDIKIAISTDHSPVYMDINTDDGAVQRGPGFWKYNSSLKNDPNYKDELIHVIRTHLNNAQNMDKQLKMELLKYEVKKFTMHYTKNISRQKRARKQTLELKLETMLANDQQNSDEYINAHADLEELYDEIATGIRIRSKCSWYEQGEKSTKYFLNLEKKNAKTSTLTRINKGNDTLSNQKEILAEIEAFYKKLFTNNNNTSKESVQNFLSQYTTPVLSEADQASLSIDITDEELYAALSEMPDDRSPGNDGLSCEFYKLFWDEIKLPYKEAIMQGRVKREFSISQRQAIIRLIEKKDRDKTEIANWRPISLLNVDLKIISKVLANRLKIFLDKIITSNQTAYVKDRFIGESSRLLSDILELTDYLKIGALLVTIDFQKAFDSLNHTFIIETCRKFGIPEYMLVWIETLLNNQESCVINGGTTTKYFKLERGARQGDPIAAYLFIIALEMLFIMVKKDEAIKPLEMCNSKFLYSAYADDVSFYLKDSNSVYALVHVIKTFSKYSDLKPNYDKCEIAGIGVLKGVNRALCGFKPVDLTKSTIKVLGMHYSYNKTLQNEKKFSDTITKIENLLRVWRQRNLSLEGKITVFKSLAISKIVYIAFLSDIPTYIIETLKKIQNGFLWNGKRAKIKHHTLCNSYETGGLQSVDIETKMKALHLSWINRLYDDNNHQWKTIPLFYLNKIYGQHSFHSHFSPKRDTVLNPLPSFYKNIVKIWTDCSTAPMTVECVLSQCFWNNENLKIDHNTFRFKEFESVGLNHLFQILSHNGGFKPWNQIREEFTLENTLYFKYLQLTNVIPRTWRHIVLDDVHHPLAPVTPVRGMIQSTRMLPLKELVSKRIYAILIRKRNHTPTSQTFYNTKFPQIQANNWLQIYMLPRKTTRNMYARYFQYRIINNILYLNDRLYHFGKSETNLCSFCNNAIENPTHLFSQCPRVIRLWVELKEILSPYLSLHDLHAQSALLGFFDDSQTKLLLNHLLLIFKMYVYNSRSKLTLRLNELMENIRGIAKLELLSLEFFQLNNNYALKWNPINTILNL